MMFASKTPRDLNRDPYPYVWEGHTPHNQMRADTDMFRKGAPFDWATYPHRPRPEYDHPQHNEPNPLLVDMRDFWPVVIEDRLAALDDPWFMDGVPAELGVATEEHREHARKVLTRLANFARV